MKRLFWMGVGVTVTILVIRKGRKVAERMRPSAIVTRTVGSIEDQADLLLTRVTQGVQAFGGDLREAMSERETALRGALLSQGQRNPEDVRAERDSMTWPDSGRARGTREEDEVRARYADGDFPGRHTRLDDDDLPYSF